ncbi:MAG TPA: GNAT family N-acetyltransferase [Micromonosporaceae bacterium]
MSALTVRPGDPTDVPVVLALLDRATEWLVANGRTDQWGSEPHSTNPRRIAQITSFAQAGGLWIAEWASRPVGALSVGEAMPYVPPVDEPELYVQLLVTDRDQAGRNIGGALLDHARDLARERGTTLLRVDCFAGGDGALVRYYERQGFTRAESFTVPVGGVDWPGQVLVQRL